MFFDKCPNCKSPSKVVGDEVDKAIVAGEFPKGRKLAALDVQTIVMDKSQTPKMLGAGFQRTGVRLRFDVCRECGTMYCVNYEVGRVAVSKEQGQPPPFFQGQNIRGN